MKIKGGLVRSWPETRCAALAGKEFDGKTDQRVGFAILHRAMTDPAMIKDDERGREWDGEGCVARIRQSGITLTMDNGPSLTTIHNERESCTRREVHVTVVCSV